MPALTEGPSFFVRDVSSGSSTPGASSTWDTSVAALPGRGRAGGILVHVLCAHIYAVASALVLAVAVVLRLLAIPKAHKSAKSSSPSSSQPARPLQVSSFWLADGRRNSTLREIAVQGRGVSDKSVLSGPQAEGLPFPRNFGRKSLARRAGGFGETLAALHGQLAPRQQDQQQRQQQPQDQRSRHPRAPLTMNETESRGISTNNGTGSDKAPAQPRTPAAAEKGMGQPYHTPLSPSSSLLSRAPEPDLPDVGPQDGSIMDGGDSWPGASALDAHLHHPVDSDAPSTAAPGSAIAGSKMSLPLSPVSVSTAAGAGAAAAHSRSLIGGSGSNSSPVRLDLATARQFTAPPHLSPPTISPSRSPAVLTFQNRRPGYAASIPPELDGGVAPLPFIHQPNPDYTSAGEPNFARGSSLGSFSPTSSSSMSAESVPTGRSHNRIVSIGPDAEPVTIKGSDRVSDGTAGDAQWPQVGSVAFSMNPTHRFAPSSFPSSSTPLLPPPPPGGDDYGRDSTFFEQHHRRYHEPRQPQRDHHDAMVGSAQHEQEHVPREIGLHGEIASMVDDTGTSWRRHTRVYGGGVCLACLANGGGFYGENVPMEERRPR